MLSRRKSFATLGVALGLAVSLLGAAPAHAETATELPSGMIAGITAVWSENGVDVVTQQALLGVLQRGGSLDAQRSDAAPVSSVVTDRGSAFVEVKTYRDGSINVFTLEKPTVPPAGAVSPQAVQGCSVESTPQTYRRCTVNGQFTGVALAFFADYQLSTASHASILAFDSATVQCFFPLSCSTPVFEPLRLQQNGSLPATVTLTTNYSGVGTGTTRLVLTVSGLSAQSN